MQTSLVTDSFNFGWTSFQKRPLFFAGLTLVTMILFGIIARLVPPVGTANVLLVSVGFAISAIVQIFLKMGVVNTFLRAHDAPESARLADMWAPKQFWPYFLAAIISGILTAVGFFILVIPGIYLLLRFFFASCLIMDKKLGALEALTESGRIAHGHMWELLILVLAVVGINIVGLFALAVGLLVSAPVSMLAIVHAYRTLEHKANEVITT